MSAFCQHVDPVDLEARRTQGRGPNEPVRVSLRNVRNAVSASLQNEQVTRQRVDLLESYADAMAALIEEQGRSLQQLQDLQTAMIEAGFIGRLRWLLFGFTPHN